MGTAEPDPSVAQRQAAAPRALTIKRHTEESAAALRKEPAHLVDISPRTFALRLPFNTVLPSGTEFVLHRSLLPDEPTWVSMRFIQTKVDPTALMRPYEAGLAALLGEEQPDLTLGSMGQTWVLAETLPVLFDNEDASIAKDQLLSLGFERCLDAVNRVIAAEQVITNNPVQRPLAKESLDEVVAVLAYNSQRVLTRTAILRLHFRPINPVFQDKRGDVRAKIQDAVSRGLESDAAAYPHPLVLARTLSAQANSLRLSGDHRDSVVVLQTAAETYLRGLHRILLVDEGLTDAEIVAAADAPFETLLTTHLPNLVGGNWSGPRSPAVRYRKTLYEVRNRITHAGRSPHWQEIRPAFEAYTALITFTEDRVRVGWRTRTRTLTAVTEEWAGGTLAVPPAARATVNALRLEARPYWLPSDTAGR